MNNQITSAYPTTSQTIPKLLKRAVMRFSQTFSRVYWVIIFAVLIQHAYALLYYLPQKHAVVWPLLIIIILLSLFIWSVALLATHQCWCGESPALTQVCANVLRKFLRIVIAFIVIALFIAFMLWWMHFLSQAVALEQQFTQWILIMLLVGVPLLLFLLLFILVIPLLLIAKQTLSVSPGIFIKQIGLWRAFGQSAKMVWLSHFKATLVVYAGVMLLYYLMMPHSRHALWLLEHHLKVLFDLVVYLLFAPLLMNYLLLLINQLQLTVLRRKKT